MFMIYLVPIFLQHKTGLIFLVYLHVFFCNLHTKILYMLLITSIKALFTRIDNVPSKGKISSSNQHIRYHCPAGVRNEMSTIGNRLGAI